MKINLLRTTAALATIGSVLWPAALLAQDGGEAVSEVSIDLVGRYDSNIARSSEARAAVRGLEREDYVISPTLTMNIVRPFNRVTLSLRGTLGYNFHARNSRLDRERIAIDGGARVGVGPCRVDAIAQVRRQQSDLADIGFLPTLPLDDVTNVETAQVYGADISCGDETGLRPTAGIEYETARNSNPVRDRAEYDSIRYTTGIQYVSPAIGRITLYASRRDVDLPSQLINSREDGYRVTEYGVRFARDLGTRIQASVYLANSKLASRNPAVRGNSSLVYGGELTALIGSRLRLTANSGREVTNSLSSDAAYVISRPNALRLTYALNERVQIEGGASITSRRYSYAFVPAGEVIERETRRIYDAGISYALGRNWRVRAAAGRDERNANGTVFDYSGTFATASIGFTF